MDRLSDAHREALRWLVKAVRDGQIGEEFTVFPLDQVEGLSVRSNGKIVPVPGLTTLGIDLLVDERLLFQQVAYENRATPDVFPSPVGRSTIHTQRELYRECYITPAGFRAVDSDFNPTPDVIVGQPPVEITDSLKRFRHDYPDPNRLAFVMMQFGATTAHEGIIAGIRNALQPHNMIALRADDKDYHEDLYYNILTYIYGVRFGIAVFERIEMDDFNPNVSLEVGYMLGLRKSVCFLKEKTLRTLHTDLVGKLYRTFDSQDPENTIPGELFEWMEQKGFISRSKG